MHLCEQCVFRVFYVKDLGYKYFLQLVNPWKWRAVQLLYLDVAVAYIMGGP